MKIVIAPDSFKGSLPSIQVAKAIAEGFKSELPNAELVLIPMADGGEGTLACILENVSGHMHTCEVTNPLGNKINASFGILDQDKTAVIEMAKASGLTLISQELQNPFKTSTKGTGELIQKALDLGCRKFIIGLGGSATCDGGMGALSALGIQFKDKNGKILAPNGFSLSKVHTVNIESLDPRLSTAEFILAHDVNNLLNGPNGAIVYAPQKGATPEQIKELTTGFNHFASILSTITQKNMNTPGTGAAGGLAAGLFAFLNAKLIPGAEVLIKITKLEEKIKGVDLIITGEGQIDRQTAEGKTPIAVAKLAKSNHIPVLALVGKLGEGYEIVYEQGINTLFSITDGPKTLEECKKTAKSLLTQTTLNIAKLFVLQKTLSSNHK